MIRRNEIVPYAVTTLSTFAVIALLVGFSGLLHSMGLMATERGAEILLCIWLCPLVAACTPGWAPVSPPRGLTASIVAATTTAAATWLLLPVGAAVAMTTALLAATIAAWRGVLEPAPWAVPALACTYGLLSLAPLVMGPLTGGHWPVWTSPLAPLADLSSYDLRYAAWIYQHAPFLADAAPAHDATRNALVMWSLLTAAALLYHRAAGQPATTRQAPDSNSSHRKENHEKRSAPFTV